MTTINFPEDVPMPILPLKFPVGATASPYKVWYRSLTPDGNIWAESSDRDEVLGRKAPGQLTFQAMRIWLVDCPWEPFAPDVNELDDTGDLAPCQPIGCDAGYHLPGCAYEDQDDGDVEDQDDTCRCGHPECGAC